MALISSLRTVMKPNFVIRNSPLISSAYNMSTATEKRAEEAMQAYWKKNEALQRPQSPWQTYKFEHQMSMSLAHRISGAAMGVVFYAAGISLAVAPESVAYYLDALKGLELGPAVMFPAKFIIAFPLIYHTGTGLRHLAWDFVGGYKKSQVKQTGMIILAASVSLAVLLASISYIK